MLNACTYTVERIVDAMSAKSYRVFENDAGYDLNLVGIRTGDPRSNRFIDWFTVFYEYDGQ